MARKCSRKPGEPPANRIWPPDAQLFGHAETLDPGSHPSCAHAASAVRCRLTGRPSHAGRSRMSIRTPLRTIRIVSRSSQRSRSRPQVVGLVRCAVRGRGRSHLERSPLRLCNLAVCRSWRRCGLVAPELCVVPEYVGQSRPYENLREPKLRGLFMAYMRVRPHYAWAG